ncbi:MAG: hypothetical protein KBC84_06200 [Proteobacteria bacterium]|nr:hypothetical protein [Pseudomonadota bacterium]
MGELGEKLPSLLNLKANLPIKLGFDNPELPRAVEKLPNSKEELLTQLELAQSQLKHFREREKSGFNQLLEDTKDKSKLYLPAVTKFLISGFRETHEEETNLSIKQITLAKHKSEEIEELLIPAIQIKLDKIEVHSLLSQASKLNDNKIEEAKVLKQILDKHGANLKLLLSDKELSPLLELLSDSNKSLRTHDLISEEQSNLYRCMIELNKDLTPAVRDSKLSEMFKIIGRGQLESTVIKQALNFDHELGSYFNNAERVAQLIQNLEQLREAKKIGATSENYISYAKELTDELTELLKQNQQLDKEQVKQRLLLLDSKSKLTPELHSILGLYDNFQKLEQNSLTSELINYIKDKSLFRADVIENFLYYDFLPVAASIAGGIILSSATGGLAACLIAGSRYRLYASFAITTAKYLGQGYGGTFGYEAGKEFIFLNAQNDSDIKSGESNFTDRSLLFKYLNQSQNITLTDVILNYNLNSLYSAAASFATVQVGSKIGGTLLNKRVDFNLWSKENLPLFLNLKVQPFTPIANSFNKYCTTRIFNGSGIGQPLQEIAKTISKPLSLIRETHVYKLISEFNEELWEEFLEETIALSGNALKDKLNLTIFNIPLLSPESALLIGVTQMLRGKSARYRHLVANEHNTFNINFHNLEEGFLLWNEYKSQFNIESINAFCKRLVTIHDLSYPKTSVSRKPITFDFSPLTEISKILSELGNDLQPQTFRHILERLTYFGISNQHTLEAVTKRCEKSNYSFAPHEITTITQHLMLIGDIHLLDNFLSKIEPTADFSNLKNEASLTLYRAYLFAKRTLPKNLILPHSEHEVDHEKSSVFYSGFEEKVYNTIIRLGGNPTTQASICGYEVDLYLEIEGRRIIVECDGDIYHYIGGNPKNGSLGKDKIKDNVLRGRGYEVIRIPSSVWNRAKDPITTVLVPALTNGLAKTEEELRNNLTYTTAFHLLNENLKADYKIREHQLMIDDTIQTHQRLFDLRQSGELNINNRLIEEELYLLTEFTELLQLIYHNYIDQGVRERATKFILRFFKESSYYASHITVDERLLASLAPIIRLINPESMVVDNKLASEVFIPSIIASLQGGVENIRFIKAQILSLLKSSEIKSDERLTAIELMYEALSLTKSNTEVEERRKIEALKKVAKALPRNLNHLYYKYPAKSSETILNYNFLIYHLERASFNYTISSVHKFINDILSTKQPELEIKIKRKPRLEDNLYVDRYRDFIRIDNYLSYEEIEDFAEVNKIFSIDLAATTPKQKRSDFAIQIIHRHRSKGIDAVCIAKIEQHLGSDACVIKAYDFSSGSGERNILEQFLFSYSRDVLAEDRLIPIIFPAASAVHKIKKDKLLTILKAANPSLEFIISNELNEHGFEVLRITPYVEGNTPEITEDAPLSLKNIQKELRTKFRLKTLLQIADANLRDIVGSNTATLVQTMNMAKLTLRFFQENLPLTHEQQIKTQRIQTYLALINAMINTANVQANDENEERKLYKILSSLTSLRDLTSEEINLLQQLFSIVEERVAISIPLVSNPKRFESYFSWCLITSVKGGETALNYLDYELRRVGNKIADPSAKVYQAILLEAIYLTKTGNTSESERKRAILTAALNYESSNVRELATMFLDKELFTPETAIGSFRVFWNYFVNISI